MGVLVDATEIRPTRHNVFEHPELLVQLLMHQVQLGYKLVTFYTASATAYVAITGFAVQYYFINLLNNRTAAFRIAVFGMALSIAALVAPFGLAWSRGEIERTAGRYADSLGLPPERFTVVRFGTWLSFVTFLAIAAAWIYLVAEAA